MLTATLRALAEDRKSGNIRGIPSICSAHPTVIAAVLAVGRAQNTAVLIEATCIWMPAWPAPMIPAQYPMR